jgi:hypothetical protein
MIVVRVELHSAITGQITEIARAHICNVGGNGTKGDYHVETLRGRSKEQLDRRERQRSAGVKNYPRLSIHVWHLVARALVAMGYVGKAEQRQASDIEHEAAI